MLLQDFPERLAQVNLTEAEGLILIWQVPLGWLRALLRLATLVAGTSLLSLDVGVFMGLINDIITIIIAAGYITVYIVIFEVNGEAAIAGAVCISLVRS